VADFVGHEFFRLDDNMARERVQLVGFDIYTEYTTAWSPVTFAHLNKVANGFLALADDTCLLVNFWQICPETLKICPYDYAAGIAEFGLFTFADFENLVPEAVFYGFQAQYLTVAIGRGHLTWNCLLTLINDFSWLWAGLDLCEIKATIEYYAENIIAECVLAETSVADEYDGGAEMYFETAGYAAEDTEIKAAGLARGYGGSQAGGLLSLAAAVAALGGGLIAGLVFMRRRSL